MGNIYSTDIQVWSDFLEAHWEKIAEAIGKRTRDAGQLDTVQTLTEFHTILVNYNQGGVNKVQLASVNAVVREIGVSVQALLDQLSAFLRQAQEAEQTRADHETERETNEDTRQNNESYRSGNEDFRLQNETSRRENEEIRQSNESARVTNWNSFFGATAESGVRRTWSDWFSDTLATGVRKLWNDFWSAVNSNWTGFWGSSDQDPNGVRKQWADLHSQATSDHSTASSDHTASVAATTEASRVNAQLSGTVVTITDRNGTARSVDIGFSIFRTYASKALMKADAANVPEGKFVLIGTTDPTDPDNATFWCRNSLAATAQEPFDFLCDFDQILQHLVFATEEEAVAAANELT